MSIHRAKLPKNERVTSNQERRHCSTIFQVLLVIGCAVHTESKLRHSAERIIEKEQPNNLCEFSAGANSE